jgi:hypothetical protein
LFTLGLSTESNQGYQHQGAGEGFKHDSYFGVYRSQIGLVGVFALVI